MSDLKIDNMNFKQLKSEVQSLRDELAMMKRKYEDILYNIGDENFSSTFIREKNSMRTQISVNAQGIETKVSRSDLKGELEGYSTIEQTDEKIKTEVYAINENLKNYSTIEQTADAITSKVTKEYVNTLIGDTYVTNAVLKSEISQSADGIYLFVSQEYETKDDADNSYNNLNEYISEISLKADSVSTRVTDLEAFKTSVFTQTSSGFALDGEKTVFTGVIYITDNNKENRFSLFHDESQGYEQVFIGSSGACTGLPIHIGNSGDTLYFGDCKEIIWGDNKPVAVFG